MAAPTELLHKLQIASGSKLWLITVPQSIAAEWSALRVRCKALVAAKEGSRFA